MPSLLSHRLPRSEAVVLVTLAMLVPSSFTAAALAHEFNTVLIVPAGADVQGVRDDMRTAFLIATRERDGHANETSEGHLGGLDVQLSVIEQDQSGAVAAADPDFVAAPLLARDDPAMAVIIAGLDVVLLSRTTIKAQPAPEMLAADAQIGFDSFAARFRTKTGTPPSEAAIAAYLAARWIDRVVRPLNSADDSEMLRRALGQ